MHITYCNVCFNRLIITGRHAAPPRCPHCVARAAQKKPSRMRIVIARCA